MADATLAFVERFNDPGAWDEILEDVPIFTEHEVRDKDGKLVYQVDAKRLHEIAEQIERMESGGKFVKWMIGHTRDPLKTRQEDQPVIVGYGRGVEVKRFGKHKKLALVQKQLFIRKGKYHATNDYPERSPEFYPQTNELTAVALLKTDPRLNLGMVAAYERGGCYMYERGLTMPAVMEPPVKKPAPDPTANPDVNAPDDEEMGRFMRCMRQAYPHFDEIHTKYAAALPGAAAPPAPAAVPGPTNGLPKKPGDQEVVHMARDGESLRVLQLEKEMRAIREAQEKQQVSYAREMAGVAMEGMIKDGYQFEDPKAELELMVKMSKDERYAYERKIRKHYQRGPVGEMVSVIDNLPELRTNPDKGIISERQSEQAIQYMRDHGVAWVAALDHVLKSL